MKKRIFIITCLLIAIVGTKVNAEKAELVHETTRIRKEASTESDIVDLISIGEDFEIISEEGEWYKIKFKKQTGYIRKDMVKSENPVNNEKEAIIENNEKVETSGENEKVASENAKEENEGTTKENLTDELQIGYIGKISSNLELKIVPSINSSVISTITENTVFTLADKMNKWCYIETDSKSGWVRYSILLENKKEIDNENTEKNEEENKDNTEVENKEEEKNNSEETVEKEEKIEETKKEEITKYVGTSILNLREKPENTAEVITGLKANTEVKVLEEVNGTWSKVDVNGKTGYVASKYLSSEKIQISTRNEETNRENNTPVYDVQEDDNEKEEEYKEEKTSDSNEDDTSSSSGDGASIVAYAKRFLGNPYVYGGTSLTNGCDCSGFVMKVYEHFGYSLPHASSSMKSCGYGVEKSNLQLGDIVCFTGHVGIYIGGNNFIHAANAKKGIIISSLSESYYTAKYIGARRIL